MSVNFTGIWNANLAKSRLVGPSPQTISVKIEHADPQLREEISVTKPDGRQERVAFQCWTNGEPDKSLLNGKAIRGGARWEGNELVIESWVQTSTTATYFCDCWSLSADGNTLFMEHRQDALAGQLTVLDRVE